MKQDNFVALIERVITIHPQIVDHNFRAYYREGKYPDTICFKPTDDSERYGEVALPTEDDVSIEDAAQTILNIYQTLSGHRLTAI